MLPSGGLSSKVISIGKNYSSLVSTGSLPISLAMPLKLTCALMTGIEAVSMALKSEIRSHFSI
jgi:hypothetical protein